MKRQRQGFFVVDAIVALGIVALLAGVLAVAVNRQHRAASKLAESRAAVRVAERALIDVQSGGQVPMSVHLTPLQAEAPTGMKWVEVSADSGGAHATLIGLVPASAVGGGER